MSPSLFKFKRLKIAGYFIFLLFFQQPIFGTESHYLLEPNHRLDDIDKKNEDFCGLNLKLGFCNHYEKSPGFWIRDFIDDVIDDYSLYYTPDNLKVVGGVLVVAGILANTNIDRSIRNYWQKRVRSRTTNQLLDPFEHVGFISYPKLFVLSSVVGYWRQHTPVGNFLYHWGYRSIRAMFIVSPQITFLRKALGGGRPGSPSYSKSKWRPYTYGRASCSGHTFNGALPFITAGMMMEEPKLRYGLYFVSMLPGISRINDNKHYFSQVFLGWTLSYLAARIVFLADALKTEEVDIDIVPKKDGTLLFTSYRF